MAKKILFTLSFQNQSLNYIELRIGIGLVLIVETRNATSRG